MISIVMPSHTLNRSFLFLLHQGVILPVVIISIAVVIVAIVIIFKFRTVHDNGKYSSIIHLLLLLLYFDGKV